MSIEAKINQRLENNRAFLSALSLQRELIAKKISDRLALYQELWLDHELDTLIDTCVKMCQQKKNLREKDLDKIINTAIPVPPESLARRIVPPIVLVGTGLLIAVGLLLSSLIPQLLPLVVGFSAASSLFHAIGFIDQARQSVSKPTAGNKLSLVTMAVSLTFTILSLIFPPIAMLFGIINAAFLLGTSGINITNQASKLRNQPADAVKTRNRTIKIATTAVVAGLTIAALFFPPLHIVAGIVAGIGSLALVINKAVQIQQAKKVIQPSSTQENVLKSLTKESKEPAEPLSFKPVNINTQDVHQHHQTRREANARYHWFLRNQNPSGDIALPTAEMLQKIPGYQSHEIEGQKPWDYILLKLPQDNFVRLYRNEIVVDQINAVTLKACVGLVKTMQWSHFDFNNPLLQKSLAADGKSNPTYMQNLNALKQCNHSDTEVNQLENLLKKSN